MQEKCNPLAIYIKRVSKFDVVIMMVTITLSPQTWTGGEKKNFFNMHTPISPAHYEQLSIKDFVRKIYSISSSIS